METQNDFARDIQAIRDAFATISDVCARNEGAEAELIDNGSTLSAEVLGQIIMTHLPNDQADFAMQRTFWLNVATHMGPDWLESLRAVTAFMRTVESFNINRA